MVTIRPFNVTINVDLKNAEYRRAFLSEALGCIAANDVETAKSVLRHYINGTVGFVKLGAALGKNPKSLMRMLSATGNPQLRTFAEIVSYLQKADKTVLTVHSSPVRRYPKAA
jgi:DNA-binding phage protein